MVALYEKVDELYLGVAKSRICKRCYQGRPRHPGGYYGGRAYARVLVMQLVSDGQFHFVRDRSWVGVTRKTVCGKVVP